MKIALITGLVSGILCGAGLFAGINGLVEAGGVLYYSPLFVMIGAIYFSIKRSSTVYHNGNIGFKEALKSGGVTALIACFGIWIGVFIAFTHTDVHGQFNAMIEAKLSREEIKKILGNMTRQKMFENARNFTLTYFLISFPVIIGSAVVIRNFGIKKS
jgi:hypothetical protein